MPPQTPPELSESQARVARTQAHETYLAEVRDQDSDREGHRRARLDVGDRKNGERPVPPPVLIGEPPPVDSARLALADDLGALAAELWFAGKLSNAAFGDNDDDD